MTRRRYWWAAILTALTLAWPAGALAATQSSSIGLQGVIPSPPPSRAATIGLPANGAVFTSTPITVSGICPNGLLIKIFDNGVFVGSTTCQNGSYSLQIDLFSGQNQLIARDYDALDQAGPDSATVTVTLNDAQFLQFGSQVTLSSNYAQRGAPPGSQLEWPVTLSGGTAPYAVSVDWGDGTSADLMTVTTAGTINLKHTYKSAGVYKVLIKATDKNGSTGFLQLVGQATGAIQSATQPKPTVLVQKQVLWWPALSLLPLLPAAFWLGGRHNLTNLRRKFEQ